MLGQPPALNTSSGKQALAVRDGLQGANRSDSRSYREDLQRGRPPESVDACGAVTCSEAPYLSCMLWSMRVSSSHNCVRSLPLMTASARSMMSCAAGQACWYWRLPAGVKNTRV